MGLGKPQLHTKFEVAGLIFYGKYTGIALEPLFGGVRGNVLTLSIVH